MKSFVKTIIIIIACAILVEGIVSALLSKYALVTNRYQVKRINNEASLVGEHDSVRIVLLSDLHNMHFGKSNNKLIRRVMDIKPDLIAMSGDMINDTEDSLDTITSLIKELSLIAPIYYSYGNHEDEWIGEQEELRRSLENAGAIVLEKKYKDISINGLKLRIGGIYGHCPPLSVDDPDRKDEQHWISEFQKTDRYKLLLCHIPLCWFTSDGLSEWNVDLVLSGHTHGGQIKIPFIGGLYVPDMGWFPGKVSGEFKSKDGDSTLIISSGLGSESIIPRFNNIPEIVSVDITID